jgi:NADH-quinone oxidoreductase subunit C
VSENESSNDEAQAPEPVPPRSLVRLREAHGDDLEEVVEGEVPIVRVKRERIEDVCRFLKEDPDCRMDLLSNLSGVDMSALDRPEPRFDVVYHLFGISTGERMTLKAAVGENEEIPTVSTVWKTANWHEREAYDMFGIRFAGHPDLRRILMPYDYDAYPLRKDFPLEGRAKDHGYWRRPEDDRDRG